MLTLRVGELDDLRQRLDLRIRPDPAVLGRDAPLAHHGRGFDDRQPRPALYDAAQVRRVPCCEMSVLRAVLAQWGEQDAVLKGEPAQRYGREEFGDGLVLGLGVGCGS